MGPPVADRSRPRLYFGPQDVPGLRARASSTHRRHSERLLRWVDAHLERQPLRGVDERFLRRSSEICFEETFAFLSNVLLAYILTEASRYRDAAREWLRALCTYPPLGSPYSVGPLCAALAHGLDWLGDVLPDDERTMVRAHLAVLVGDAVACSHSPERSWWSCAYLRHDYWIPTAGYGIGALALPAFGASAGGVLRFGR